MWMTYDERPSPHGFPHTSGAASVPNYPNLTGHSVPDLRTHIAVLETEQSARQERCKDGMSVDAAAGLSREMQTARRTIDELKDDLESYG